MQQNPLWTKAGGHERQMTAPLAGIKMELQTCASCSTGHDVLCLQGKKVAAPMEISSGDSDDFQSESGEQLCSSCVPCSSPYTA